MTPEVDADLLRRFGHIRAVGGALYFITVAVLFVLYGARVWPMLIGVPVLAVVTTAYFLVSSEHARAAVVASLGADLVVLVGGVMFLGGAGSGLTLLYSIVIVSGGIMLGPSAARTFTIVACIVSALQFLAEGAGLEPVLLARPEAGDRLAMTLVSIAGLASVGYLTGAYASRLHDLLATSAADLEALRSTSRRRHGFVSAVAASVTTSLSDLERVADEVERRGRPEVLGRSEVVRESEVFDESDVEGDPGGAEDHRRLAADLRVLSTRLQEGIEMLADVGVMDALRDTRPEPILLSRIVADCLTALRPRLAGRPVTTDLPPIRVVGDRRGARRIVYNLIENVVEHTPAGTPFDVTVLINAGRGVLVVSDDGPGIDERRTATLFSAESTAPAVGLPLVRELAEAMGAEVRYERAADGGARFLIAFRLAPPSASQDDAVHEVAHAAASGDSESPGSHDPRRGWAG